MSAYSLPHLPANFPDCRAVLLPVIGASGELSWDSGRWESIGQTAVSINQHCVRGAGMPGVVGSGGMEVAGIYEDPWPDEAYCENDYS